MRKILLVVFAVVLFGFSLTELASATPMSSFDGLTINFTGIVDSGWVWEESDDPQTMPPQLQDLAGYDFSGSISIYHSSPEVVIGDWEFNISGFDLVDPDPRDNFLSSQDATQDGYHIYFLDAGQSAFVGDFNYFDGSQYVNSMFAGGDAGWQAPGSWYIQSDNFTWESNAAPVPEPATMFLFGTGLVGFLGSRMRRKKL